MRIQLIQAEIEEALADFIVKQGFSLAGKDLQINFTAGRGATGVTADLDIEPSVQGRTPRHSVLSEGDTCAPTPAVVESNVTAIRQEPVVEPDYAEEPVAQDEVPFDVEAQDEPVAPLQKESVSLFS